MENKPENKNCGWLEEEQLVWDITTLMDFKVKEKAATVMASCRN